MNNINLEGILKTITLEEIRIAPFAYHIFINGIGAITGSIQEHIDKDVYVLRFTDSDKCTEIFKVSISKNVEESIAISLKKDVLNYMEKAFNDAILKYFVNIQVLTDIIDTDNFQSSDFPFEDENAFERCKQVEHTNYSSGFSFLEKSYTYYYSLTNSHKYAIVGIIDYDSCGDFGIKKYIILKMPVYYYESTFSKKSIHEQLEPDKNIEVLLDMKLNEFIYGLYTGSQNERELVLEKLGDISFDIETSGEGVYRKFRDSFLLATKN